VAAGDTRNIKINVTIDSDTKGSEQAAAGLEKVDKAAGKAEGGLADLTRESEKLDVQLAKSKTKVKELEQELIRTGDRATGRGSLRSRLNQERSWLREMEKLTKSAAEAAIPDLQLKLPKLDFSNLVSESKGGLIAGAVGIAAVMAPAIGAIISGAVAGTVAGGGILGGVFAASSDPRVRLAFKDFTSELTADAFGGGAFVKPVVEGIGILKDAFRNLNIDEALTKGAASVTILAQGIADLVTNLMPGFNAVMDQAEAFTTVFADGLGDTGAALSDMLKSIMSSEGTIEGLAYGFKLLVGTIVATGNILEWLGNRFHDMVVSAAWFTGVMEDVTRGLENVARATTQVLTFGLVNLDNNHGFSNTFAWMNDKMEDTADVGWKASDVISGYGAVLHDTADSSDELAEATKRANDEFERTIDLQASMMLTNIDIEQGLQDLADQFAENGGELNTFTDAGRDNEKALIQMAQKMRELRDEQIALGGSTADADAALAENYQRLLDQAEAAGISRAEVEKLIAALFAVPALPLISTRAIDPTTGEPRGKKAAGGAVSAGVSYLVGENQAEVFTPSSNGYISSSVGAWAGGMGGGGGTPGVTISFAPTGDSLIDALIRELRKYIRIEGGDVQIALGQ
jgi:hypothetical protein